jgi:hypothetical protein
MIGMLSQAVCPLVCMKCKEWILVKSVIKTA